MHHHQHRTVLGDLPDSCLLQVFKHLSPLPDKFSVGATCWRFWRLVSDKRLWLVVSPTGRAPESAPGGAGPIYTTLAAAVQASRPGDTIWLAPGVTHSAADVDVPWPLHILGGGTHPSETWLAAPQHADCVLHFTASAKVAQLSVSSTLCPCIIHKRGSLTVQNCLLASEAKGLHHLVSPVLTLAVSAAAAAAAPGSTAAAPIAAAARARTAPPPPPAAAAAAAAFVVGQPDTPATVSHGTCDKQPVAAAAATSGAARPAVNNSSSVMVCRPPACIGPGKLQVVECQLMGGSTAVRCGGTGHLRNVRAIYEAHSKAPYFWLEADSADGPAAAATAAGVGAAAGVGGSLWEAAAGAYLQQHKQELAAAAAAAAAGAVDGDADASDTLLQQQRSKAWQQRQAVLLPAAAAVGGGGGPGCPSSGLARIHAVLGGRSINPVSLAAHLTAKQQQQQDGGQ